MKKKSFRNLRLGMNKREEKPILSLSPKTQKTDIEQDLIVTK
jgi:hypothetical protein